MILLLCYFVLFVCFLIIIIVYFLLSLANIFNKGTESNGSIEKTATASWGTEKKDWGKRCMFCPFLWLPYICEFLKFILHQTLVVYRDGCSFNGWIVRLRNYIHGKWWIQFYLYVYLVLIVLSSLKSLLFIIST